MQATSWCPLQGLRPACCFFLKLLFLLPNNTGYIVVLDYKGYANGELFEDTTARRKPIVFLYGKRPFSGGMCLGVEKALATMRAGERVGGGGCLQVGGMLRSGRPAGVTVLKRIGRTAGPAWCGRALGPEPARQAAVLGLWQPINCRQTKCKRDRVSLSMQAGGGG